MALPLSYVLPTPAPDPAVVPVDEATRDLYGYDILFTDDFQLTGAGDYARVGGEENLRRAIYRRLLVRPGEYRFRPSYGVGLGTFVKKVQTQAVLDELRQRIIDQLSAEVRIDSVAEVTVESTTNIDNRPMIKVYVKVVANGRVFRFDPFLFSEEA